MFREWIALFKDKGLMEAICDDYENMLRSARDTFGETANALLDRQIKPNFHEDIEDRRMKFYEREASIRRRITEHLCINPAHQIGAAMTVFGNAYDARRLGSLCCDLEDLVGMNSEVPFTDEEKVKSVLKDLASGMDRLIESVLSEEAADGLSVAFSRIKTTCREEIEKLTAHGHENSRSAVMTALTFRYCRRLAAYSRAIADASRTL